MSLLLAIVITMGSLYAYGGTDKTVSCTVIARTQSNDTALLYPMDMNRIEVKIKNGHGVGVLTPERTENSKDVVKAPFQIVLTINERQNGDTDLSGVIVRESSKGSKYSRKTVGFANGTAQLDADKFYKYAPSDYVLEIESLEPSWALAKQVDNELNKHSDQSMQQALSAINLDLTAFDLAPKSELVHSVDIEACRVISK